MGSKLNKPICYIHLTQKHGSKLHSPILGLKFSQVWVGPSLTQKLVQIIKDLCFYALICDVCSPHCCICNFGSGSLLHGNRHAIQDLQLRQTAHDRRPVERVASHLEGRSHKASNKTSLLPKFACLEIFVIPRRVPKGLNIPLVHSYNFLFLQATVFKL